MTATALGEQSAMHKTKVSRAVAELERRRWLVRTTDENDRRVEHLALTKAGLAAYGEMVPLAKAFERELLERLSTEERTAIVSGVAALEAKLTLG
ncbi:MarR family transcriptional regulator [Mesorhizobium sp. LSHC440B00]|nr:MarR family transcriptional regulator [Mesorhizobium sp. LSHC440B00]ESX31291.1 MarR family transcriptional regulator [Mesorhizobium sp. LSHC440A00]ESX33986.1 MarR family transcriptional regulator [Mesorhizobium sp. LSHC432A00]